MTKVFLIFDDEPLTYRNIRLVDNEEQAKAITENDDYMYYEELETMSDDIVKDIVCDEKLRTMDNAMEFVDAHCMDCDVGYNEVCPYID